MYQQSFVLIPYWYENALTRNDLTLVDILDYSKIRNIMSIMDIAQLTFINGDNHEKGNSTESLKIKKVLDLRQAFCNWTQTAQEEQRTELVSVLPQLLCSADLGESVVKALTFDQNDNQSTEQNQTFKIVDLSRDVIAIVLYKGFVNVINSDIQSYVGLLMDLLEKLYSLNPVHEVNQSPLFKELVASLDDNRVSQLNLKSAT